MSTAAGVKPAADGLIALFGHDPATYVPHPVHAGDRTYHETDCYTDILIELVHARGDQPLAVLGSLVRLDFEGDQWTFFKPDPRDLEDLLGIDIHEMQPWRPLPDQIAELLETGRTMTIELDAWFLPDTAATSYRREHVKTSVIPEAIDRAAETLRYYHNASLYELVGEDYRGVFRLDAPRGSESSRHTPSSSASTPDRDSPAMPCAARRSTPSATTWRASRPMIRSPASATASRRTCRGSSTATRRRTTRTPSPRSAWRVPASSCSRPRSRGCWAITPRRSRRPSPASSRAPRPSGSSWPAAVRSIHGR